MTCVVLECTDKHLAKGLCRKHYQRWKRHGDPSHVAWEYGGTFADRMDRYVPDRSAEECWEWKGLLDHKGYGETRLGGQKVSTHRASYEHHVGPVPDGLWVLHTCNNPPCCRPSHLYAGTPTQNTQDRMRAGHGPVRSELGKFISPA